METFEYKKNQIIDKELSKSLEILDSTISKSTVGGEGDKMLKHTRIGSSGNLSKSGSPMVTVESKTKAEVKILEDSDKSIKLPQRFVVKYLGVRETSNLWGIKYTRGPVDTLVVEAKRFLASSSEETLPLLKLEVTEDGIIVGPMPQNSNPNFPMGKFSIESISYGVQDLVYTRVFAMIVVKPEVSNSIKLSKLSKSDKDGFQILPYRCHAFVTDTRETAKNLTFALAAGFQKFSQKVSTGKVKIPKLSKFAIDLRSQEELEADLLDYSEA